MFVSKLGAGRQRRESEKRKLEDSFASGREEQQAEPLKDSRKRLSAEEYAEVKRRKKENDKLRKEWPRIIVNEVGRPSSLILEGKREPLFMGDVQSLLFYSLLGNKSSVLPRWVNVINTRTVSHVVMVHVEGVGLSDIKQDRLILPNVSTGPAATINVEQEAINQGGSSIVDEKQSLNEGMRAAAGNKDKHVSSSGGLPDWLKNTLPRISYHMNHSLEIVAPSIHGACPVEELLLVKTGKTTKRVIEEDLKKFYNEGLKNKKLKPNDTFFRYLSTLTPYPEDKLHHNDKFSRLKLLLNSGDLAKWSFPLPLPGYKANTNKEFVLTSDNYGQVTSQSPMFALDCEMCLTTIQKLELASISVVNEKLELVYHTLVLPYNIIINYLTKYSGITPEMLMNVTKRLEDVQQDLKKLLPPDAILVGHSLDSDLTVLKMMHPYVIDSSLAYNLSGFGRKRSSLKALSEMFLNERIQSRLGGHDPTEDAIAALKLIQLKLRHDEAYGNVIMGWEPYSAAVSEWQECHPDTQQHQQQEPEKDPQHDIKEQQQPEQEGKALAEQVTGPFNKKDLYIFQRLESCDTAIITTALCLKHYLPVLASLNKMPTMEVLSGNKQVSQRAVDFVANSKLTYIHFEMGRKLSLCPDEATHHRQLTKLDKRLQRIHKAAAAKSVHIYVFSGSSTKVPLRERSNGFILVGIKDLPFRT